LVAAASAVVFRGKINAGRAVAEAVGCIGGTLVHTPLVDAVLATDTLVVAVAAMIRRVELETIVHWVCATKLLRVSVRTNILARSIDTLLDISARGSAVSAVVLVVQLDVDACCV
jgi:hypothetical protein